MSYKHEEGKKVICLDFDLTLANSVFPDCGTIKEGAKEVVNELYDSGHCIVIWTCRTGKPADDVILFLEENGVKYHYFNENPQHLIDLYGCDSRKASADIYVDDKHLLGIPETWAEIREVLKTKHLI